MKCKACGTEIDGSADVCPSCGVYIVVDSKYPDFQLGWLSPLIIGPLLIFGGARELQGGLSDSEVIWTAIGLVTIALGALATGYGMLCRWRRHRNRKPVNS